MGIEPMTPSLPRKYSTPELRWLIPSRAEDEVRTRDPQLGRLMLYRLSYFRKLSGESRIRTYESITLAELQSAPVGHFGISPIPFNISISRFYDRCRLPIGHYLSRWRDSNPRPADYKSAALAN